MFPSRSVKIKNEAETYKDIVVSENVNYQQIMDAKTRAIALVSLLCVEAAHIVNRKIIDNSNKPLSLKKAINSLHASEKLGSQGLRCSYVDFKLFQHYAHRAKAYALSIELFSRWGHLTLLPSMIAFDLQRLQCRTHGRQPQPPIQITIRTTSDGVYNVDTTNPITMQSSVKASVADELKPGVNPQEGHPLALRNDGQKESSPKENSDDPLVNNGEAGRLIPEEYTSSWIVVVVM